MMHLVRSLHTYEAKVPLLMSKPAMYLHSVMTGWTWSLWLKREAGASTIAGTKLFTRSRLIPWLFAMLRLGVFYNNIIPCCCCAVPLHEMITSRFSDRNQRWHTVGARSFRN
jgi:hypothetical protein